METARTLALLLLAGAGLSLAAWWVAWWRKPGRRLRRALRRVLNRTPDAQAISPGEGRAAGLDVTGGQVAVLWDLGDSGLVFAFREVEGAELTIDGEVAARVRRGEAAKPLDRVSRTAERVALRLLFTDARWPEFELDLAVGDALDAATGETPEDVVKRGRRWLAHIDAIVRRPLPAAAVATPEPPAVAAPIEERPEDEVEDEED
jgi:hypothetical protein